MQWDEKELDMQFTPNVYFWTPNPEILAKALNASTWDICPLGVWVLHDYPHLCIWIK